jgi:hypothetical protein
MKAHTLRLLLATTAFAFTLAACSSDESAPEHGTPTSAKLFDTATNTELQPIELPASATTRVTVHFYDADGDDISQALIDTGHFTSLTFGSVAFATSAPVSGQVFQRDVTVFADPLQASTVTVGYGHNVDADELAFGPYPVTAVEGAPVVRRP